MRGGSIDLAPIVVIFGALAGEAIAGVPGLLPKSVVKTGGGFGLSPDFTRFSPRSVGLTNF